MQNMEKSAKPVRNSIECWIARPTGNEHCRVLLLRVVPVEGAPDGFWQGVTGGIEAGETAFEACLREVREETGIGVPPESLHQVADGIIVEIPDMLIRKALFLAVVDGPNDGDIPVVTEPNEHTDYRWVAAADVLGCLYWDSNRMTWGMVSRLLSTIVNNSAASGIKE